MAGYPGLYHWGDLKNGEKTENPGLPYHRGVYTFKRLLPPLLYSQGQSSGNSELSQTGRELKATGEFLESIKKGKSCNSVNPLPGTELHYNGAEIAIFSYLMLPYCYPPDFSIN
jgi:hypothetical protein